MTNTTFKDLGLDPKILLALDDAGYQSPTEIQEKAIPQILMMKDVIGIAQTGTGKTASFTLPMIEVLNGGQAKARMPRALVLTPTRELAAQVADNIEQYSAHLSLSHALIVGGVQAADQIAKLERGVDILIATPGRLLDLYDRGNVLLKDIKFLVIDEADRMLDMGFIPDIEKVMGFLPPLRQNLLFSATMPKPVQKLAENLMSNPKTIEVAKRSSVAKTVTQKIILVQNQRQKSNKLIDYINDINNCSAFVFCNRKRDIDGYARALEKNKTLAGGLHGDMSQIKRTETLEKFKNGEIKVLVCSDVAARGIDISGIDYVFNMDLPLNAEDYVHRIGRTGRAGKTGEAYSFVYLEDEQKQLDAIEKLIGHSISKIKTKRADKILQKPKKNNIKATEIDNEETPQGFGDELPAFMAIGR